MLKGLKILFSEIEENVKNQKEERKEYFKIIEKLLKKFYIKEKTLDESLKRQLSFYYICDRERNNKICFNFLTVNRKNKEKGTYKASMDIKDQEKFKKDMDFIVNYLINNGKIENFIQYLSETAIPLFLQNQLSIPDYIIY